ncbi:hypothetical protein HW44_06345 [Nitrosococcus oceani]|nr:hypothetical protein HW44_06345 [Nitrosococcus oceani]
MILSKFHAACLFDKNNLLNYKRKYGTNIKFSRLRIEKIVYLNYWCGLFQPIKKAEGDLPRLMARYVLFYRSPLPSF